MKAKEASRYWWLMRSKYIAIFLRELSSVFILSYVILYLLILNQLQSGTSDLLGQYAAFPFVAVSISFLAFSLYHSITWFLLLPKIQPLRIGRIVLTGKSAFLVNLGGLLVSSFLVASLVYGVRALPGG